MTSDLHVEFLSPEDSRAALVADLLKVNREARRTTRMDNLGRENVKLKELHEYLNFLLTQLEY